MQQCYRRFQGLWGAVYDCYTHNNSSHIECENIVSKLMHNYFENILKIFVKNFPQPALGSSTWCKLQIFLNIWYRHLQIIANLVDIWEYLSATCVRALATSNRPSQRQTHPNKPRFLWCLSHFLFPLSSRHLSLKNPTVLQMREVWALMLRTEARSGLEI